MSTTSKTTIRSERSSRWPALLSLGLVCALAAALLIPGEGLAQTGAAGAETLAADEQGRFEVPVNKSGVIRVDSQVSRVSVGNPGVADVLVLRSNEIYVVGKTIGSTNVTLWDRRDRIFQVLDIDVTQDLGALKRKLHELLPDEPIGVDAAQERIVLTGQVSSAAKMDAAKELATGFLADCVESESNVILRDTTQRIPMVLQQGGDSGGGGECKQGTVINLMEVGGAQQIMLEVTVAEVARSLLRRLDGDINFVKFRTKGNVGGTSGGGTVSGTSPGGFTPDPSDIAESGLFANYLSVGSYYLQAILEISQREDLAKILAEPTLTTLSGQEAEFLSGGEFPIPVPQGGATDTVTIEFKEFGVGVKFVPMVLDSGHINLKLNVSVSDISAANNVLIDTGSTSSSFLIPSLTKRSANSTVELSDGQTIGIAGLISDNVREFVDKFPVLGDLPVLGAFFRSEEFLHDKSELVIFVTPHLARPIAPSQVRLPTDSFVPPSGLEFYLFGRLESGADPSHEPPVPSGGGTSESRFGHRF